MSGSDVDRTLDELIADGKGGGRKGGGKGKRGKGGRGGGNKESFWSEPNSSPWGESPAGTNNFWLHDDRAGGMPDPNDYKTVKGKSKGGDDGSWGPSGKGRGKNRAEPYDTRKETGAGKWKHDLYMALAEDEYEPRRKKGGGKGKKGGKGGGAKAGGSGYCPW
mmetsp:Transcript_111763/g.193730  ORF Transcript_111763/g.193730 Transcript_111763/m.193730 type:complete len:163 (-) Transcript_111763:86-574(-)